MNEKELETRISDVVAEFGVWPQMCAEKIMLLVKEFNNKSESKNLSEEGVNNLANWLCEESVVIRQMIERKGWTKPALKAKAVWFIGVEYPSGGMTEKIRKHFYRWIAKQTAPEKKTGPIIDAN